MGTRRSSDYSLTLPASEPGLLREGEGLIRRAFEPTWPADPSAIHTPPAAVQESELPRWHSLLNATTPIQIHQPGHRCLLLGRQNRILSTAGDVPSMILQLLRKEVTRVEQVSMAQRADTLTALQTSAPLDAVAWSLAFREKADDGPLERLVAGDASLSLTRWPVPFGYWEPQAKDLTRLSALFLQFSCTIRQASDIAQCTPTMVQAFLRACWRTNPDLVQEDPIPQLRGRQPPRPPMSSLQLFYLRVQCAREPLKSEQLPL